MSYQRISFIQPNRKYRPYRRTSFFRRRTFRFWTIKLTFVIFACKNQYFVVDWSRRVFTGEKVNWPAAYSWITLDFRYMAKISAAAYLRTRLTSEFLTVFSVYITSLAFLWILFHMDCMQNMWWPRVTLLTWSRPWLQGWQVGLF